MKQQRAPNPVIPDYRPKSEKVVETPLSFTPCCNPGCDKKGKPITDGYYGRWGNSGTCCGKCENEYKLLPKYPPSNL